MSLAISGISFSNSPNVLGLVIIIPAMSSPKSGFSRLRQQDHPMYSLPLLFLIHKLRLMQG